jgi:signal transduction histidine kinase/CheY-like chemotaxis protein
MFARICRTCSAKIRYTLAGIGFGCLFPLGATLLEAWKASGALGWTDLAAAQTRSPLLWIIDSAPLFLGFFASLAGVRQDRLRRLLATIQADSRDRTSALQRDLHHAEAASDLKSLFLANMSHEIRTPLTAILGYAENLRDPELTERERADAVRIICDNGDHLLRIVNDILDLSKIEAGRLDIEAVPCSPRRILAEVVTLMRARAGEKGLDLRLDDTAPLPRTTRTDPTRLRQILLNLVGNAIRYTPAGQVRVEAWLDGLDTGAPRLACRVSDSGPGLSAEDRQTLFEPFVQGRRGGHEEGTGLGLTITRHLVELLGGEIEVASEPGRGSAFTVRLPTGPLAGVEISTAPDVEREPAADQDGRPLDCRILVVEDNLVIQRFLEHLLRKHGGDPATAGDGGGCLELVERARRSGRPFDVILMDLQLPELNGYETTRILRERGFSGAIVALTANALMNDRERCLQSGFDGYATKPIERGRLLAEIRAVVRTAAPTVP